jgi:hypothetical protein
VSAAIGITEVTRRQRVSSRCSLPASRLECRSSVFFSALPPGVVSSFASKFFYWNDIEVVPVVDIAEAVTIGAATLS